MNLKPGHSKIATVVFWVPSSDNNKMKYLKAVLKEAIGCDASPCILKMDVNDVDKFHSGRVFYKTDELFMRHYRTGRYILHPYHTGFMDLDTVEKLTALISYIKETRGITHHLENKTKGSYYLVDLCVDRTTLTNHPKGYDTLCDVFEKPTPKKETLPEPVTAEHPPEESPKKYRSVDDVLTDILNVKPVQLDQLDSEFSELSTSDLLDIHALITKHYHRALQRDRTRWNDAVTDFVDYGDVPVTIHTDAQGRSVNIFSTDNSGENREFLFADVLLESVGVNYYRTLAPISAPITKQAYSNILEFSFNYPTQKVVIEMGIRENPLEGRTFERSTDNNNNKNLPKRPTIQVTRGSSNDTQYMSNEWISLLEHVEPAEFIEHLYHAFVRDSAYARG